MPDQFITCTTCHTQIPLTQALRADIQEALERQFAKDLAAREHEWREAAEARVVAEVGHAREEAARQAQQRADRELARLRDEITDQRRQLEEARAQELALRRRERELERARQELELTVARQLDAERARIVEEAQGRLRDEHRLKDAEKERQLADMRRQIDDLRRKADQGSQQLQGEAGEWQLESVLRESCRTDDITAVSQGVRGADITHTVLDTRGARAGCILWECKNTRHWNDAWIGKLKMDQRAMHADVAVLVTACLPRGVSRFGYIEGVLVTDFASAAGIAHVLRSQLIAVAHARTAALHKEERLELLHRYLTGTDFRHRVEALVEAFAQMRQDLDQERRAAERQWARRARQMEIVTLSVAGMYGDLQGLVPALPSIAVLELPGPDEEENVA